MSVSAIPDPTVVLVHGSVTPGWATWEAQRPSAGRYRLVVPHRTGYPPNPPLERIDFEVQAGEIAELVDPGTHLVWHSYGGVVSLLAAGLAPERIASFDRSSSRRLSVSFAASRRWRT